MKAAYRANARFVMSKALLFEVASFKDTSVVTIFNPISAARCAADLDELSHPGSGKICRPKLLTVFRLPLVTFVRGYLIVDRIGTRVIRDPFSNKPYVGFYTVKRLGGTSVGLGEHYTDLARSV
jgi:predicted phage gp36 major capsid-like protein